MKLAKNRDIFWFVFRLRIVILLRGNKTLISTKLPPVLVIAKLGTLFEFEAGRNVSALPKLKGFRAVGSFFIYWKAGLVSKPTCSVDIHWQQS